MACGQCIFEWDFQRFRYVLLLDDCQGPSCRCGDPPRRYYGQYIYVECFLSPTTTEAATTTTTTSGTTSSTTSSSTTTESSSISTSTTYPPITTTTPPPMECIPEKIRAISVIGYGEIHVPVSDREVCATIPYSITVPYAKDYSGYVVCGSVDDILSGNIFQSSLIGMYSDKGSSLSYPTLSIHSGVYVDSFHTVCSNPFYTRHSFGTLRLPESLDYIVVNGLSYISGSLDFNSVPLRFIYLGPDSTLSGVWLIFNPNDVPNYLRQYSSSVSSEFGVCGQTFSTRFQDFYVTFLDTFSWTLKNVVGNIESIDSFENPRLYCRTDQKSFSKYYRITALEYGLSRTPKSYKLNIGDFLISGSNDLCYSDTPAAYDDMMYILIDGPYNQLLNYRNLTDGMTCCPYITGPWNTSFCKRVCPGNMSGPVEISSLQWKYKDLPRAPVPYDFSVENVEDFVINLGTKCVDENFEMLCISSPRAHVLGGCDPSDYDPLGKVRIEGYYRNIPVTYLLGDCEIPVTLLCKSSKPMCKISKVDGSMDYLYDPYADLFIWFYR